MTKKPPPRRESASAVVSETPSPHPPTRPSRASQVPLVRGYARSSPASPPRSPARVVHRRAHPRRANGGARFRRRGFLASPLATIRTFPDGKLVSRGHVDDATLLDVVSHGFFHPRRREGFFHPRRREGFFHPRRREGEDARVVPRDPSDARPGPARPGATHATRVEPPRRSPSTSATRDWRANAT